MDFYARQEAARRTTRWLLLAFLVSVALVVAAVDAIVVVLLGASDPQASPAGPLVLTTIVVLAIICGASLFKTLSLRAGGGVVARSLGGARIERNTRDPALRRLHNVVEEMAIASGVTMPEVYVLENEDAHQRVRRRQFTRGCRHRRDARRGHAAVARRAAGRGGARVQPHPQRRHAPQPAAAGLDLRPAGHRHRGAHRHAERAARQQPRPARRRGRADAGGAGRHGARLHRRVLRPPAAGGGLAPSRAAGGCLGGAVHPQSRRACRARCSRSRASARARGCRRRRPRKSRTCCLPPACRACSRLILRSKSGSRRSTRRSAPAICRRGLPRRRAPRCDSGSPMRLSQACPRLPPRPPARFPGRGSARGARQPGRGHRGAGRHHRHRAGALRRTGACVDTGRRARIRRLRRPRARAHPGLAGEQGAGGRSTRSDACSRRPGAPSSARTCSHSAPPPMRSRRRCACRPCNSCFPRCGGCRWANARSCATWSGGSRSPIHASMSSSAA